MSTTSLSNSHILPILKPLIIEGKKGQCLTVDHYIKATYVRRDGHCGKNMGEKPQKMKQHNEVCQETFKRSGDRKQHVKAHIPVCVRGQNCGRSHTTVLGLESHIFSLLEENHPFMCKHASWC